MKTTKPTKARIKARRMYTTAQQILGDNDGVFKAWYSPIKGGSIRLAVLDLSDEAALIEQIVQALSDAHFKRGGKIGQYWHDDARAVLVSLGIIRRGKRSG